MEPPKLRVTYADLQRRVRRNQINNGGVKQRNDKNETAPPPRQERRSKRPDQAIYRPGHMRQGKSPKDDAGPDPPDKEQDPETGSEQKRRTPEPVKGHIRSPNDVTNNKRITSLNKTPPAPGQRFGPRRKTTTPSPSSVPRKAPLDTRVDRPMEDDSEELMLDADAMVVPHEEEPESLPPRFNSRRDHYRPGQLADQQTNRQDSTGRQGRGLQTRVYSRREDVDPAPRETASDVRRRKPPDLVEPADGDDEDTIYDRKVLLGGNMKITCSYSKKTSPLKEQLENEGMRDSIPAPSSGTNHKKSPRAKLHSLIKAREKYESGSSAGGDDRMDSFTQFASESDNWDSEMDRADYQLQTMVISSSKRRGRGSENTGRKRGDEVPGDEEPELRHPRGKGTGAKGGKHGDVRHEVGRHADGRRYDEETELRPPRRPRTGDRGDKRGDGMDKDGRHDEGRNPRHPGAEATGNVGGRHDNREREEELRKRHPRNDEPEPEVEDEDFFWDEDVIGEMPQGQSRQHGAREGGTEREEIRHSRPKRHATSNEDERSDMGRGSHHTTGNREVRGRGSVGSRLRQDSESSEETWRSRDRRAHPTRVERVREESGNSRSSDDYYSDSDRHEEVLPKGGGLLRIDDRGSHPRDIPGKKAVRAPRDLASHKGVPPGRGSRSPPRSPKPKDKMLWDPSKPNERPALEQKQASSQLVFVDSDSDPQNSPAGDRGSLEYPTSYQGYDPSASYQPVPYQGYPTNPQVSSSWADQADPGFVYPPTGIPPQPAVAYGYYSMPPPPTQSMNFDPQQVAAMHGKRAKEQAAMQVVLEAATKETEFSDAVAQGVRSKGNLMAVLNIRKELEKLYEGIVLLDLQISSQYNIEQLLWKNAYYQLCELLKKDEFSGDSSYKDAMVELLQSGTTFYEELLEKLQSTYCFKLETKTGLDPLHEEPRRTIKLAILSAQRCMIALGDIARYKELAHGTSNYGRARSWYTKAQRLAPRNGKPYNQLAILALYTRRKLDAVYYYMRSLAASNPFITARESLMTLFEEVRKKIEHKEQEVLRLKREREATPGQRPSHRGRGQLDDSYRREVWINYDGTRSGVNEMEGGENDGSSERESSERELQKMPPAELNKRFVLSFLNVHGKLFTKIGMEAFSHAAGNLLREFSALLGQSPNPIASTRLLQLMAINMFAVENTNMKEEMAESEDMRPYLQELAVQLVLDMFIVLVHRCSEHLKNDVKTQPKDECLSEDLHEMLPAVKVVADWMMCHPEYWNPPPNVNEEHAVSSLDVWETIATFLNILKDYKEFGVDFMPECEDSEEILLPEDHMLSGFVPLQALPLRPLHVSKKVDKVLAMDSIRITSLKLFGEFIHGQETPLITFDGSRDCYISVAPRTTTTSEERTQDDRRGLHGDKDDGDVVVLESYTDGEEGDIEDNHVSHLRERRHSLEKQLMEQQQKQAKIQEVIERQRTQRDLVIEVSPVFLIPDTNCFIDHLPALEELVASQRYTVIVPLVVINELDGLSRGIRDDGVNLAASQQVAEASADAVDFLERTFDVRNKHLKAMTSKGTTLNTIAYRSEESKRIGTNDDLILKCCLHYCEDNAREFMPSDKSAPVKLRREVVLLTNDRNLRVKAIHQNVPTREVLAFLRWAKG